MSAAPSLRMSRGSSGAIIGIDASNIRGGGGVTHLVELLKSADPHKHAFSHIVVWSGRATLDRIDDRSWLTKDHPLMLDKSLAHRVFWQRFRLSKLARRAECDVLFVPGGSYAGNFRPIVAFNQNLLPFEWRELRRYGWSMTTSKMLLLRLIQTRTFRRAEGVIFLTRYARDAVMRVIHAGRGTAAIIPHGVDPRFATPPKAQRPIDDYSVERPFRVLYVSVVDVYKHQWHVADAVAQLRNTGLPLVLDFIGPASEPSLARLMKTLQRVDPRGEFVRYHGPVPHEEIHTRYAQADLCLFASSCETFGQILIEGMSAGLPVASADRSAMPELLGTAGVYFDPERPDDIARTLLNLVESPELRQTLAAASFERARLYSWPRCAAETFAFIGAIASRFAVSQSV